MTTAAPQTPVLTLPGMPPQWETVPPPAPPPPAWHWAAKPGTWAPLRHRDDPRKADPSPAPFLAIEGLTMEFDPPKQLQLFGGLRPCTLWYPGHGARLSSCRLHVIVPHDLGAALAALDVPHDLGPALAALHGPPAGAAPPPRKAPYVFVRLACRPSEIGSAPTRTVETLAIWLCQALRIPHTELRLVTGWPEEQAQVVLRDKGGALQRPRWQNLDPDAEILGLPASVESKRARVQALRALAARAPDPPTSAAGRPST